MWTLTLYNFLTIAVSTYFFSTLYMKESQFFVFSIYVIKSKFYFCLMLNLMAMIAINFGKLFIKLFFGEIRLSELIQVVEKIRVKIITFLLIFLTLRPTIDFGKIILIAVYMFMSFLSYLICKRADYVITLAEHSKKSHLKLLFLFIFFSYVNFAIYEQIQNLSDVSNKPKNSNYRVTNQQSSDSLIFYIFSCEFIFLLLKLLSKIIKFVMEITQIYMNKTWEYKAITFNFINLFKYIVKLFIEVKFCMKLVKAGVIPLFFMMDVFYSAWSLFKMVYKIYQSAKLSTYIKNLPDYKPPVEEDHLEPADNAQNEEERRKAKENNQKTCIICLHEIESGKMLSCGHIFHLHCIKEWIATNTTCPTCKSNLIDNKEETKKITQNRLRQLEDERQQAHNTSLMNKKLHETSGLPFIQMNKSITNYLNLKKINDFKKVINENINVKSFEPSQTPTGAISFSLPCQALMNRSLENELHRLEIENYNQKLLDLYDNPQNMLNHFQMELLAETDSVDNQK